jgi:hypothetical protein
VWQILNERKRRRGIAVFGLVQNVANPERTEAATRDCRFWIGCFSCFRCVVSLFLVVLAVLAVWIAVFRCVIAVYWLFLVVFRCL